MELLAKASEISNIYYNAECRLVDNTLKTHSISVHRHVTTSQADVTHPTYPNSDLCDALETLTSGDYS